MIKQDEGISGFILNVADTLNEVGAYRIEMVIEDGDNKIALECDGERWHTQENLPNDLKRQAILERLEWRFIGIRGSAYYRNQEDTMKTVYEKLYEYDINYKNTSNKDGVFLPVSLN